MEEFKIETIKHKSSKLLADLNMKKRFEIEEIKEIEMKLEKLKIPTTNSFNAINRIIEDLILLI